jgi:hypothetical protein
METVTIGGVGGAIVIGRGVSGGENGGESVAVISARPGFPAVREVLVSEGDPTLGEDDRQI